MEIGTKVFWESHAPGADKVKRGELAAIIPAGESAWDYIPRDVPKSRAKVATERVKYDRGVVRVLGGKDGTSVFYYPPRLDILQTEESLEPEPVIKPVPDYDPVSEPEEAPGAVSAVNLNWPLPISEVRIIKVHETGATRAVAAIVIDGCLEISGIRLMQSPRELFVMMPQRTNDFGIPRNIAHPTTSAAWQQITSAVLDAYYRYLEEEW